MVRVIKGFQVLGVVVAALFSPAAVAAVVKAPKKSASPVVQKSGPSTIAAWLQKAVDAHQAEGDSRLKARIAHLRQKLATIATRKEGAARLRHVDETNEALYDGEDSARVEEQIEEEAQKQQNDGSVVEDDSENVEQSDKKSEEAQLDENTQNAEDHVSEDALDSNNVPIETVAEPEKAAEENADNLSDHSDDGEIVSSGEDSDAMAFTQRVKSNKKRLHSRRHSSFLARSQRKGSHDDEGSFNDEGNFDRSDYEAEFLGTEENREDANDAERQRHVPTEAENQGNEEDSGAMNLMQKPIRGKDAAVQWRLHKSHLATKSKRNKKASEADQRSVVYELRNAAAELERSVQKYMQEDDKEAAAQKKAQRDLVQETRQLQQHVDSKISDEPTGKGKGKGKGDSSEQEEDAEAEGSQDCSEPVEYPCDAEDEVCNLCKELCACDSGPDKESCMAECRTHDTGELKDLKDFVADEDYNELGDNAMSKKFEKETGVKTPKCTPTIDTNEAPTFESVDKDGSGGISRAEMDDWSLTACVPNELSHQVFDVADVDFNQEVSPSEWADVGEDLKIEQILDQFADRRTKGEDEYEPTELPGFGDIDTTQDGKLDEDEIMKMFKDEIVKRIPNMPPQQVDAIAGRYKEEVMQDMGKLDTDGDGMLNEQEYQAAADNNMGKELQEVAKNPNNLEDPDDLHQDP